MESVREDAGAKGSVYGADTVTRCSPRSRSPRSRRARSQQRRGGKGNHKGKSKGDGRDKGGKKVFATWRSPDSTRRISKFVMTVNVVKSVEFSHDSRCCLLAILLRSKSQFWAALLWPQP